MNTLPIEIVNEILLRVDRPSLYHTSQVCTQWRALSLRRSKNNNTVSKFQRACRKGDFLSVIRSKFRSEWLNQGLHGACRGGHKDLVELMITKGADHCPCGKSINEH